MFRIDNYNKKPAFCSFLPGISGARGIPAWCFYVNRGQAICSFGMSDKDHAIMEFNPAHYAYSQTQFTGMRTFIRRDGRYFEAFAGNAERAMLIESNVLSLEETREADGVKIEVSYCTVPEERFGGLLRRVRITNTGDKARFEILDGMAAVTPYGVDYGSMKFVAQTSKAWMRADDLETGIPYYHVSVSMGDTADVTKVDGGHFAAGVCGGERIVPVVDPDAVFAWDTAMQNAVRFAEGSLSAVSGYPQVTVNRQPCAFFGKETELASGESITLYEVFGQVSSREQLDAMSGSFTEQWYEEKFALAAKLTAELTDAIATTTADPVFDEYCRQTYLDNVLRGGKPVFFGEGEQRKVFWLYSRKHGDPERDYNYFTMSPEYYSQGNGNFRDVNQNRRSDVLFDPRVGKEVIRQFYSLIQIDGCNPLAVDRITYTLAEPDKLPELTAPEYRAALLETVGGEFTPGKLAMAAESWTLAEGVTAQSLLDTVIGLSESEVKANFGEGYWCDHWTYNLDLVESYLAVYPECKQELMSERVYPWFESGAVIRPRAKRYTVTANGLRQYNAVDHDLKKEVTRKWLCDASGERVKSSLLEKLVVLSTVKFATLDPSLMGIEMDGGKPGWYDALNGLPGIFGSSMCETAELARMLRFTLDYLAETPAEAQLFDESADLFDAVVDTIGDYVELRLDAHGTWDALNIARERYVACTAFGVKGEMRTYSAGRLTEALGKMLDIVLSGIERASTYGDVFPTYFYHEAVRYEETADGIKVLEFKPHALPLYLEGPVRLLKLDLPMERKKSLYENVRRSGLYDKKLSMYKVNESLADLTFEAGRCCAFTPGWLENESVWLHMEYKYLLELLKSGLYDEYAEDLRLAAVPFLDPEMYGRSTLENSSFIESSANPDTASHGRGFVARLSGSTAEFLQMWQIMMFGERPFIVEDGELCFRPTPFVPDYLIPESGIIEATALGSVRVVYHTNGKLRPDTAFAACEITYVCGNTERVEKIKGDAACALRSGKVAKLEFFC